MRKKLFNTLLLVLLAAVTATAQESPAPAVPEMAQDSAAYASEEGGIMDLGPNADVVPTDTFGTDGFYMYNMYKDATPFPYPAVNMMNVKFFKRVWRDIDLTDAKNGLLTPPGSSLVEVLIQGINQGRLTAFDPTTTKKNPTGDAFTRAFSPRQAMQRLTDSVLVPLFDSNGEQISAVMKLNDFNPSRVTKFRIKEDIFYDRQRSRIETRIIGLAPLIQVEAGGEVVSEQPAYWLYFPQARNVLVTKESAEPEMTLDDVFVQHKFVSQIIRESNPDDNEVQSSADIEREIAEYKKKTWRY